MQSEYNVELRWTPMEMKVARWPGGAFDRDLMRHSMSVKLLEDREGNPVLLFNSQYTLEWVQEKYPDLVLSETPP